MSGEADGGAGTSRWDLSQVVTDLRRARQRWRHGHHQTEIGREGFPSLKAVDAVIDDLKGALFPRRLGPGDLGPEAEDYYVGHTLNAALTALYAQVRLELAYAAGHQRADARTIDERAQSIVRDFAVTLHEVRGLLDSDRFEHRPLAIEDAYAGRGKNLVAREDEEVGIERCRPCRAAAT